MMIEWNRVTWYSKTLAAILFVDVFFFGYWLGTMNTEVQYIETERVVRNIDTPTAPVTSAEQTNVQEDDWREYRNEKYGYKFEYPNSLVIMGSESSEPRSTEFRSPAGIIDSIVFLREEEKIIFKVKASDDRSWLYEWKSRNYYPPLHRDETNGERSDTFLGTTTFNGYPAIKTIYCDYSGCDEQFIIEDTTSVYTIGIPKDPAVDSQNILTSFSLLNNP